MYYKIIHGWYDTAVAPSLMISQVSHTRGNMYKLQKNVFKCDIRKYFLLKELLTCGTRYHPWLSMHLRLLVLRHD